MSKENAIAVVEPRAIAAASDNTSVMDKLLCAASNGMDIATIEKFMELAERNEKNEARRAYNKAFAAFKADPPNIKKDKKVNVKFKEGGGMSFEHASIGNVVSSIISKMSEFGLSHSWFINQNSNSITVTCRITHELGHYEETGMTAGADVSGKKNSIQSIASTITYLERYTIQAATGIAVLENDDDGAGHIEPKQPEKKETKEQDRKIVDKWLKWLDDGIKSPGCTVDAFNEEWESSVKPLERVLPQSQWQELVNVKSDSISYLMEQETK